MYEVQSELYIHAAASAAWSKFSRLADWPIWNSEILDARWLSGKPWQENSRFLLRHKSLFGSTKETHALLRMVVPGQSALWESQGAGMTVVHSAAFRPEVGGCRLSARHSYHGAPSLLLWLLQGRQQQKLDRAMAELKGYIESWKASD